MHRKKLCIPVWGMTTRFHQNTEIQRLDMIVSGLIVETYHSRRVQTTMDGYPQRVDCTLEAWRPPQRCGQGRMSPLFCSTLLSLLPPPLSLLLLHHMEVQ